MVSKSASRARTKKTISGLLLAAVVSIGLTVVPVAPALAAGCSSGQANFGCGAGAAPPPAGGNSGSPAPASPPAPSAGGGGTILPVTQTVDRRVPDPANNCPVRDDGAAPLGADYIFDTQWASTTGGPKDYPNGSPSWIYQYSTPNGTYFFQRTVFLHRNCLYPPRTYFTTAQCIISSTATINLLRSANFSGVRVIKQASASSGYTQGSTDYSACVNSNARVDPRATLTEYGYYTATAVSKAQTALVEVAYTPNDVTGVIPAPKIVSLSGVYNLTPVSTSGSLECSGFFTPGSKNADFTETPCSDQNKTSGGASYQCVQGQPLFDSTVGAGSENLIPFPASNSIQGLKDGNPKHIVFSQKPVGASITVNSYDTFFTRDASSTPWKSGVGPQGNLFTLNTKKTGINGHNIFNNTDGTKSPFTSGQANDVWATSIEAGSSSAPTKLTQVLQWKGTKTVNSVEITSIDVLSGKFTYTTKTIQVPTTGQCKQTVAINYVRTTGDYLP